jgi:hypothetical protein
MLPSHVTVNTCAALTGRSPRAIRALIASGVLPVLKGTGPWRRIPMAAVIALRGEGISAEEFLETAGQLGRQRGYWSAYAARRRSGGEGVSGTAAP